MWCLLASGMFWMILLMNQGQALNVFQESHYRSILEDQRAQYVGDNLTVLVMETARASTSAAWQKQKKTAVGVQAGVFANQWQAGLTSSGHQADDVQTRRDGMVKAALTVKIIKILANQHFLIQGQQRIVINGEQQLITLQGEVRLDDITVKNTVLSTRIANAKIIYAGDDSVSKYQRRSFIYKFFSFLGLI